MFPGVSSYLLNHWDPVLSRNPPNYFLFMFPGFSSYLQNHWDPVLSKNPPDDVDPAVTSSCPPVLAPPGSRRARAAGGCCWSPAAEDRRRSPGRRRSLRPHLHPPDPRPLHIANLNMELQNLIILANRLIKETMQEKLLLEID
jgi:hypothetical protein